MSNRIVVAFPLYKTIPVKWFFQWTQMAKDPVVGTVATEGIYLPVAMGKLVELAFDNMGGDSWDYMVVYEHDMIPPLDGLQRMAEYDLAQHDIVGSTYFKHEPPYHVMAWGQVQHPFFSPYTGEVVKTMVENPGLYEVDGVAMGFTAISRRVFEQWDKTVPMWEAAKPLVGHDLHFCNEAKQQGFRVWLDSGIGCGHLTEIAIGYSHSQEALAAAADELPRWPENGEGHLDVTDEIGIVPRKGETCPVG